MTPTKELYGAMEVAYNHFNESLFDGKLPAVLFTTQRKKNVMGYFALERWVSVEGVRCHEVAINPAYVGRSALIELLQTLVHEMAHCWQFTYGKPGRRGYHNKEWADMMESIGLMPSATGAPGGAKTGERMNDYPIPGGRFIKECQVLISDGYGLPWVDRFAQIDSAPQEVVDRPEIEALELEGESLIRLTQSIDTLIGESAFVSSENLPKGRIKSRYSCPGCKINVWGKPELNLSCSDCEQGLIES